jgi:hypothetical protein
MRVQAALDREFPQHNFQTYMTEYNFHVAIYQVLPKKSLLIFNRKVLLGQVSIKFSDSFDIKNQNFIKAVMDAKTEYIGSSKPRRSMPPCQPPKADKIVCESCHRELSENEPKFSLNGAL